MPVGAAERQESAALRPEPPVIDHGSGAPLHVAATLGGYHDAAPRSA